MPSTALRAQAADVRGEPQATTLLWVQAENDYFDFWLAPDKRPDDNYTQSARVSLLAPQAPWWGQRLGRGRPPCRRATAGSACLATSLTLGQEMYTPTEDSPEPRPGQRPYAGWLYLAMTAHEFGPANHQSLALSLGVTGPPSLAAATQDWFHHLVPRFRTPLGWAHQLPTTLGVGLAYEWEHLALAAGAPGARTAELVSLMGGSIGNVLTEARLGMRGRVGLGLASPWATPITTRRMLELYLLGEVRVEAIARNLFLDARTLEGRPQVERVPLVPHYSLGGGARWRAVALEYRAVTRGQEYRTGPGHHTYGSITLAYHPSR